MALNDTVLNIGANAMRSAMAYLSLHTAIPNIAGDHESSAPRQAFGVGGTHTRRSRVCLGRLHGR